MLGVDHMARLTKSQSALHMQAMQLLSKDVLSDSDKEFVLTHYHEAATNNIAPAGAFFTPLELARQFAEHCSFPQTKGPTKIVDLCAGIGMLAYAFYESFQQSPFNEQCEITCVEINPEYIEIGRKILPEANWVQLNLTDLDALKELGIFDLAISNPPFGAVPTFKHREKLSYTGSNAAYYVIEIASMLANTATFIIPQKEAGFKYSGEYNYQPYPTEDYTEFSEQTGIELGPNNFSGTKLYQRDWRSTVPVVEFAEADFSNSNVLARRDQLLSVQHDFFGCVA
jgi:predicted RNA methylase